MPKDFNVHEWNKKRYLGEAMGSPKAIILAGAPGAGKGYVLSGLDLGGLKVLNVDNVYIDLLKKANVSLDLKMLHLKVEVMLLRQWHKLIKNLKVK